MKLILNGLQGNVETWLMELLNATRNTVHSVLRNASIAINDPAFKLLEFENMFPAQVTAFPFTLNLLFILLF